MGLFQKKQTQQPAVDKTPDEIKQVFDEQFREELREHGRQYFEKTIADTAGVFKKDLDAVITQVNTELREQIVTKLDAQLAEYGEAMKDAQYLALQSLNRSQHSLQDQYQNLTKQLDAQFVEYSKAMKSAQDVALQSLGSDANAMQERHKQLIVQLDGQFVQYGDAMKVAQDAALQTLNSSAQAMQEHYQQFSTTLQKNVADQEASMVSVFEGNMAKVIEHYLLGALGDQYDLKAQLPSIIKQMEANKQAIVDDMKL